MLSSYCAETSCYNKVVDNSTFTSDLCNHSYCEVDKTVVPTVPDIDNYHWFFNTVLYIGGVAHLMLSLFMVISYFLVNAPNFVLPGFCYRYMYVYSCNLTLVNDVLFVDCKLKILLHTLMKRHYGSLGCNLKVLMRHIA